MSDIVDGFSGRDNSEVGTQFFYKPIAIPECEKERADIIQRLQLLLHAKRCDSNYYSSTSKGAGTVCRLHHCQQTKNTLSHIALCKTRKTCTEPFCEISRRIVAHWKACIANNCPICLSHCDVQLCNAEQPNHALDMNRATCDIGNDGRCPPKLTVVISTDLTDALNSQENILGKGNSLHSVRYLDDLSNSQAVVIWPVSHQQSINSMRCINVPQTSVSGPFQSKTTTYPTFFRYTRPISADILNNMQQSAVIQPVVTPTDTQSSEMLITQSPLNINTQPPITVSTDPPNIEITQPSKNMNTQPSTGEGSQAIITSVESPSPVEPSSLTEPSCPVEPSSSVEPSSPVEPSSLVEASSPQLSEKKDLKEICSKLLVTTDAEASHIAVEDLAQIMPKVDSQKRKALSKICTAKSKKVKTSSLHFQALLDVVSSMKEEGDKRENDSEKERKITQAPKQENTALAETFTGSKDVSIGDGHSSEKGKQGKQGKQEKQEDKGKQDKKSKWLKLNWSQGEEASG